MFSTSIHMFEHLRVGSFAARSTAICPSRLTMTTAVSSSSSTNSSQQDAQRAQLAIPGTQAHVPQLHQHHNQQTQGSVKPAKRKSKPPSNLADKEGSPFHELGLKDIMEGMGRVRVRQHVNPLSSQFQQPTASVDWAQVYGDPQLPLFVDCGCGPGRFLLLLCRRHQQQQQQMNYLGLEIRQPLVERANKWAAELGVSQQVHYLCTNVSVSLLGLLRDYPGPIATLSAQFPDPHFKKRHKKRRMVQGSVVETVRDLLMPGGQVFLQSDVYDAVAAMRDEFEQHAGDVLQLSGLHTAPAVFNWTRDQEQAALTAAAAEAAAVETITTTKQQHQQHQQQQQQQQEGDADQDGVEGAAASSSADVVDCDDSSDEGHHQAFASEWAAGGWLVDNPLGVPTEREHYVQAQGGKVFRVMLVKQ